MKKKAEIFRFGSEIDETEMIHKGVRKYMDDKLILQNDSVGAVVSCQTSVRYD